MATTIALSAFHEPINLILGGLDRGQDFLELKDYMQNVKNVLCYGETKDKIKNFCDKINISCLVFNNLKETVEKAKQISLSGDIVLLSPACASWDQYKCFEDRGLEFKNLVNNNKQ